MEKYVLAFYQQLYSNRFSDSLRWQWLGNYDLNICMLFLALMLEWGIFTNTIRYPIVARERSLYFAVYQSHVVGTFAWRLALSSSLCVQFISPELSIHLYLEDPTHTIAFTILSPARVSPTWSLISLPEGGGGGHKFCAAALSFQVNKSFIFKKR